MHLLVAGFLRAGPKTKRSAATGYAPVTDREAVEVTVPALPILDRPLHEGLAGHGPLDFAELMARAQAKRRKAS